ncbi:MAG: winged helix-turn-helix domain-containing protein [Oligoflexia bacterium]|nr:winged helix-turn-helix domain-containing protein [Oligoflexia bacterium]
MKKTGSKTISRLLQVAQLRSEKCELLEAREAYEEALEIAKEKGDLRATMEALSGLLRLASEAIDSKAVAEIGRELDALMKKYPKKVPPMAWYCKGAIARHEDQIPLAKRCFLRFLATTRAEGSKEEEAYVRGWLMMAVLLWQEGRLARSLLLVQALLKRFEACNYRGVNGMLYQTMGGIYEKTGDYESALFWFHKAHAAFLGEHSWYYHLYVLYAYARIARKQRHFSEATWYLDLIEKAVAKPEFGVLRRELERERKKLGEESVDMVIDLRAGTVTMRDSQTIALGKQYVLLHILEALAAAQQRSGDDRDRGLSKAEIIGIVWHEMYRPEAHDNKLYYNINRLRKHVEEDAHHPKILMNWKEGYRLAPGLKVQVIGGVSDVFAEMERRPFNADLPGLRTARERVSTNEVQLGEN